MKPWNNNANGGPRKRAWTPVEDEQLRSVVLAGPIKWSAVAELIGTRNAKQCRERWHYQLNPDIKKGRWTADEDALISNLPLGDWARVAKELPGRTDMAIKNRYHTLTRRKCSAAARRRGHGAAKSRTQPYDDDDEDEDAMADDDDAPDRARESSPTPDEGVQPARKRRCNSNSTTATNEQAPVVSVQSSASIRPRHLLLMRQSGCIVRP
ncbi:Homeodomain-like protein [Pelagophyceae sp. CCMP2097]|nr:Homeodomain-like protein [Pelagophyceae sp. CCMP2097]